MREVGISTEEFFMRALKWRLRGADKFERIIGATTAQRQKFLSKL